MPIEQPVPKEFRDKYVAIEQDLFWLAEHGGLDEAGHLISALRAITEWTERWKKPYPLEMPETELRYAQNYKPAIDLGTLEKMMEERCRRDSDRIRLLQLPNSGTDASSKAESEPESPE